jgi:general secretion pathway protein B
MSYILDALRRADAEREGSALSALARVPAEPLDDLLDEQTPAEPRRTPGTPLWIGVLLGVLGLAALLMWWQWPRQEQPLVAAAPPEAKWVSPGPPPIAAPPAALPPAPPSRPVVAPAAVVPAVVPDLASVGRPVRSAEAPVAALPVPPKAQVASEDAPTPTLAQLPEAFRRSLPAIRISGSTYSPLASARMLIVNGQVHQEGGEPAPGLKIREIKLRSAVFEYSGQRYEVGF